MQTESRPIVWSIAGSDSGGGAGIQADLPVIQALGGHGATVITTLTAQNSLGVQAVSTVETKLFCQQLQSLASDLPPRAIKIGLLGHPDQARLLCRALPGWRQRWPGLFVVLDPVLVATSGDALTDDQMPDALRELLPHVDLVTPNTHELGRLSGFATQTRQAVHQAAARLAEPGCAVLAKGGHCNAGATPHIEDLLLTGKDTWYFRAERLPTAHRHGTGCTLSSAIATLTARGLPLHDAVAMARTHLQRGLQLTYATGAGAGTLSRHHTLADCFQADCLPRCTLRHDHWHDSRSAYAACNPPPQGIYPVVPDSRWVARLLHAGARIIQLRIKQPVDNALLDREIRHAVELGRRFQAQVFINDHWRQALRLGAYGVHLGQEDIQTADLEAIRNAGLRLGVSSHGYAELLRVLPLKPSYVALGHLFPTATKLMPSQPQGLLRLADLQRIASAHGVPTVAIGGIKATHLAAIRRLGVNCAAVVTALTESDAPEQCLQTMHQQLCGQPLQTDHEKESLSHD